MWAAPPAIGIYACWPNNCIACKNSGALKFSPRASIKADLAASRWELTPRGIKVEDEH